jgi:HK97 family phage portal protein
MHDPFYLSRSSQIKAEPRPLEQKNITQFVTPTGSSSFGLGTIRDDWTLAHAMLNGYEANLWVAVCVGILMEHASELPWRVWETKGSKRTMIEDHPLEQTLSRPNPHMMQPEYVSLLMSHYQLAGNGLSQIIPVGGVPELWILSPDLTRPTLLDHDGKERQWIHRYERQKENGQKLPDLEPEEVVHARQPNPRNPIWGLPRMKAGSATIDTDTEHTAWNQNLAGNSMVPSGILTSKALIGDKAKKSLEKALDRFKGSGSSGRPLVLESELLWQQTSFGPKEIDWLATQQLSIAKIGAIFGFNPRRFAQSSGLSDSLSAVYESEWRDGTLPGVNAICAAHSLRLLTPKELAAGQRILPDVSEVPQLREELVEAVKIFDTCVGNGIPVGTSASIASIPIPDDMPTRDEIYRRTNLESITDGDPLDEDPSGEDLGDEL